MSIGLLGLLPVLAAINRPATSVIATLVVLVPSAVLGALVLRALASAPVEVDGERRQLLTAAAVLAASAAVGVGLVRHLSKPSAALAMRLKSALPPVTKPLAARWWTTSPSRGASLAW